MSVNDASRIVIDNSRVTLQIVPSLTDDSKGIIYNDNMSTVHKTGRKYENIKYFVKIFTHSF